MKYTRTAIGLLTAQYRAVLKKCFLINAGLFALGAVAVATPANAETIDTRQEITSDTTYTENVTATVAGSSYEGGAIKNSATTTFEGTAEFTNNTAERAGGALYNTGALVFDGAATFTSNRTTEGAGGAIANSDGATVTFHDTATFSNNTSLATTPSAAYGIGGAIYNQGTMTFDKLATFTENQALEYGNAITNYTTGIMNFKGGLTLSDNTSAAGYVATSGITNDGVLSVVGGNVTITGNTAHNGAGIASTKDASVLLLGAYKDGSDVVVAPVESILFQNNTATDSTGGALYTSGDTEMYATNITFDNNDSNGGGYGGAIGVQGGTLKIIGDNNTFTNNDANGYNEAKARNFGGGAIQNRGLTGGSTLIIGESTSTNLFDGNTSAAHGGAIHIRPNTGEEATTTINGETTFSDNEATLNGGAISNFSNGTSNLTLDGSLTFTGNTAGGLGGAIYNEGTTTISGEATFSGNTDSTGDNDIYNAGILNLAAAADKTISFEAGITGDAGTVNITGTGVIVAPVIKNQTVNVVAGGEFQISTDTTFTDSTVAVASNGTINSIDGAINDYTSLVTLADGAKIKGDIDYENSTADSYAAASGANVTYVMANALGDDGIVYYGGAKEIQVVSDGAIVNKDASFAWYDSDHGLTLESSGNADGKVLVSGAAGGIDTAVETTDEGTQTNINYTLTADETFDSDHAIEKSNFAITGQGKDPSDPILTLAKELVVSDDSQLSLTDMKLAGDDDLTVYGNLIIKDSSIDVKINVATGATLTSDPTTFYDKITVNGTSTFDNDAFVDITISTDGAHGAAIENHGTLTLTDTSFTNNKLTGTDGIGGAIYSDQDFVINSSTAAVTFTDNADSTGANDIYLDNADVAVNAKDDTNTITFNGGITGQNAEININGDGVSAGTVILGANSVSGGEGVNINLTTGTLNNAGSIDTTGVFTIGNGTDAAAATNTGTVSANIAVAANGVFTNNNAVTALGGSNDGTIAGNGAFTLDNASGVFDNNTSFTQNSLTITNGEFQTDADNLHLSSAITNNGTLTLEAGTLANAVSGTGQTKIAGTVVNSSTITQETGGILISSGSLTTNAGVITGAIENNVDGGLVFTAGVNANAVTGTGSTVIDGTVTSMEAISNGNGITIVAATTANPSVAGKLTISADNVGAAVTNNGNLVLQAGTLANAVSGTGATSITGAVTNSSTITGNDITIAAAGNLITSASDIDDKDDNIVNNGTLTLNAGTLSEAVTGDGQTVIAGTVVNSSTITQETGGILISSGSLTTAAGDVTAAIENNADEGLVFTGGTNANAVTGTGSTKIDGDVTNGAAISQAGIVVVAEKSLTNNSAITVTDKLTNNGTLTNNNARLINGSIDNYGTFDNNGILQSSSDTVSNIVTSSIINNTGHIYGTLVNDGTVNNTGGVLFEVTNNSTGTINADTAATLLGDIANEGTLNIAGGHLSSEVTGAGVTNFSGTSYIDEDITQTTVNVSNGTTENRELMTADLNNADTGTFINKNDGEVTGNVVNDGSMRSKADKLATGAGSTITNNGTLELTDGELGSAVSGTGSTIIDGNVSSTVAISNDAGITIVDATTVDPTVAGKLTIGAGNVGAAVTNNGDLVLQDGTLAYAVSGDGATEITGAVVNSSTITQETGGILISSGSLTTAAGDVTAAIENNVASGLVFTGGTNANAVSGTGSTVIDGDVTSNASIASSGGITVVAATTADPSAAGKLTIGADNVGAAVTNDGDLVLQAGTLANAVSGDGATEIAGAVINGSTITQETGGILISSGSLTTDAGNVSGDIENNVASGLVFTGGTNANAVTGTGSTVIDGDVTSTVAISNSAGITIVAATTADPSVAGKLTIGAGDIGVAVTNDGDLVLQDGTLANNVSGNGATEVIGSVDFADTTTAINQAISITGTGTLTADGANIGGEVTNDVDDGLVLIGGTLSQNVGGAGSTKVDTGDVTIASGKVLGQDINIASGSLTAAGESIGGTVDNASTLNITGGTLAQDVTGAGTTNFSGVSVTTGSVEQDTVTVADKLTNSGTITATVENNEAIFNNDGTVDGDMTNTGGVINNNAGGTISGGTLTNSGASAMITNAGTISSDIANEGIINNTGAGTLAAVTSNSGTITSAASGLTGDIASDGTLNIGAGDMVVDVTGNGTTNIQGAVDLDDANSIANAINIVTGGSLTASADGIDGAVNNAVANGLVLRDGELAQNVSGAGSTKIIGDVELNDANSIGQAILVDTTGELTANADGIGGAVTNNGGLELTGGELSKAVSGDGTTTISGAVENSATITDNDIEIVAGGTLTTDADDISDKDGEIENAGGLELTGGTLGDSVSGAGHTDITGDVDFADTTTVIGQAINIAATGELTANGANIGGDVTNLADDGLILTGGELAQDVSGAGSTSVTGDVTLNDANSIAQAIDIAASGSLEANADGIGGAVTNAADDGLILTGGTLAQDVSGAGSTNVTGDVVLDNANSIGQAIDIDAAGSLTANADGIGGEVANEGLLDLTGGTLGQNVTGAGETLVEGDVALTDGKTIGQDIEIDAAGSLTANANGIGGTVTNAADDGLVLTGGTLAQDVTGAGSTSVTGNVTLNDANSIGQAIDIAATGSLTANADGIDGDVTNAANDGLILTGGTLAQDVSGAGSTNVTGAVTLDDANSIGQDIDIASAGSLTANADGIGGDVANEGTLDLTGGELAQNVTGAGDTVIDGDVVLNDANSIAQAIDIIAAGSLTANANGIGGDVSNEGLLDLTGGELAQDVIGGGSTSVTGDVTLNDANSIAQAIDIAAAGSLTANANGIGGDVANEGLLDLTGGTLSQDVSGAGSTDVTGDVILTDGNTIGQAIDIDGAASLTANADGIGGVVANEGLIDLTGGTLAQDVSGAGTMNVTGDVINDATIVQSLIYNTGTFTTDAENITAPITNDGTLKLGDSTNQNNIDGIGLTEITGNMTLGTSTITGNKVQVNNGASLTLNSGNLDNTVSLSGLNGSKVEIADETITVKDASFEQGSTVALNITQADKFGNIKADKISGENGVNLKVSLNPDAELAKIGRPITYQLFESGNTTLGDFTLDFDNKDIYKFRQVDTKGVFEVALVKTAQDVVKENGGNANQVAAAKAWIDSERFEEGTPAAEMSDRLADAAQYRPMEFLEGLTDVSPSENPVVYQTELGAIRQVYNSVASRMSNGMSRKDGVSSGDYMDGMAVWTMGLYDKAHMNSHNGITSLKSESTGVALGIEKMFNPYFKSGIGYSYMNTDIDTGHRTFDIYTHTAFAYGEYKPNNWFVNGIMSYGWSRYKENQKAMGMTVKSKYDAETFATQAMLGREFFTVDGIGVTPSVGLRYVHVKQDDHHDSLGSHISGNQSDTLTGIIGLKLDRVFHVNDNWSIKPEIRGAVGYDMVRDDQRTAIMLTNGAGYNIQGRAFNRWSAEYGAALTANLNDTWEMTLSYEGQLRQDYKDNAGMISLKYKF